MDLTETEDIKKRWQQYTKELCKKNLYDPDNHNGVITHLEQDTMECKVKWAFQSITMKKASGGDGNVLDLDNNNLVAQMIKNPPAMWETWV